jgi:hypothetical protein
MVGIVDECVDGVVSLDVQDQCLLALYPRRVRLYRLHHAADLWFITKERIITLKR